MSKLKNCRAEMFRSWERKSLQRRAGDIWFKGFAAGYRESHHDTMEFFTNEVIREIQEDAVLSITADLDTLERIVEIIEAVRDDGETPHGKTQN
jgi:acyl-CoA reductase-like NAD-dependent aldehyde dehydrogenase